MSLRAGVGVGGPLTRPGYPSNRIKCDIIPTCGRIFVFVSLRDDTARSQHHKCRVREDRIGGGEVQATGGEADEAQMPLRKAPFSTVFGTVRQMYTRWGRHELT